MFLAGICVITFMNSDKTISKIEGLLLILLYVFFIILESLITNVYIEEDIIKKII
jgi:Ca2+/Na+ antiporter